MPAMNIMSRLLRAVCLALCAALAHASFTPAAWAAVAALPRVNAPVSVPAAAAGSVRAAGAVQGLSNPSFLNTHAPASFSAAPAAASANASAQAASASPSAPAVSASAVEAVAAPDAAPVELNSGPLTAPAAKRAGWRFDALKRLFSPRKAPEETPAAVAVPSASEPASAALAPASAESKPAAKPAIDSSQPLGAEEKEQRTRSFYWFLAAVLVMQIGVEILGLAMPLLMRETFGGFAALAQISVVATLTGVAGRLLGGWLADRFGVKLSYATVEGLRVLSIGGMVLYLVGMSLPAAVFGPASLAIAAAGALGFAAVRRASRTSDGAVRASKWVKWGTRAAVAALAVGSLMAIGVLPGLLPALASTATVTLPLLGTVPVAFAVLAGFYGFNGFVGGVAYTIEGSIAPLLLGSHRATLERLNSLKHWLMEVVAVPSPKLGGFVIQAFGFYAAIVLYPFMLAAALAMFLIGVKIPGESLRTDAEPVQRGRLGRALRARIAPLIPTAKALFSFAREGMRRLIAGLDRLVLSAYLGRWIQAAGGKGKVTDADEHRMLSRSTRSWTLIGIASLASFATMMLPMAWPAYAAMVFFGVGEVIAAQKLYALMMSRTKDRSEALQLTAVSGAIYGLFAAAALVAAGKLFDGAFTPAILAWLGPLAAALSGPALPFAMLTAAMIPLGLGALFSLRRLIKAEAGNKTPSRRGYLLLFSDPVARWAFLGFVLLSVTNPLLYSIVSQAFGLALMGSATAASGVASWITAIYSFGGLAGALYMWRESTLIESAKPPKGDEKQPTPEEKARAEAESRLFARSLSRGGVAASLLMLLELGLLFGGASLASVAGPAAPLIAALVAMLGALGLYGYALPAALGAFVALTSFIRGHKKLGADK